jgi:hypothetical protein
MRKRIRTGITTHKGLLQVYERCNKHGKVWKEGESDGNKCCMECINNSRPTRYGKP